MEFKWLEEVLSSSGQYDQDVADLHDVPSPKAVKSPVAMCTGTPGVRPADALLNGSDPSSDDIIHSSSASSGTDAPCKPSPPLPVEAPHHHHHHHPQASMPPLAHHQDHQEEAMPPLSKPSPPPSNGASPEPDNFILGLLGMSAAEGGGGGGAAGGSGGEGSNAPSSALPPHPPLRAGGGAVVTPPPELQLQKQQQQQQKQPKALKSQIPSAMQTPPLPPPSPGHGVKSASPKSQLRPTAPSWGQWASNDTPSAAAPVEGVPLDVLPRLEAMSLEGAPRLEQSSQLEAIASSDPVVAGVLTRLDEMYSALYGSWSMSVRLLEERFVAELPHNDLLLSQIRALRTENNKLKSENFQLRTQQQWQPRGGVTPMSSSGLTPLSPASLSSPGYVDSHSMLLTPQHDMSHVGMEDGMLPPVGGGEDEKAFESQIDKAKLKTKLCKYFMQSEQGICPFFRRHGWCAFAHGEKELHTVAVTAPLSGSVMGGTPMMHPTPPLAPSPLSMCEPIPGALSPSMMMESIMTY